MRLIGRIFFYLLAGIGTLTAVTVVTLIVIALQAGEREPLPEKIVLMVDLARGVSEGHAAELPFDLGSKDGPLLRDVLGAIARGADDDRVEGLVLDIGRARMSVAHVQAIRRAVLKFRESGKFAYAFAEDLGGLGNGTLAYYLASAAEKVSLQPSGTVGFIGLAIEAPFFGDTLDKLEVARRVQQRHEYKGAGEMFVRRGFSEEVRRSLEALIDSWMSDIAAAVAEARNLTPAQVRRLTDMGPFLAKEALDNGLIDALSYRDEFEKNLESKVGSSAEIVSVCVYNKFNVPAPADAKAIAVITGTGAIVPGHGKRSLFERSRKFHADNVAAAIRDAAENPLIVGVVVRIDSPGGSYGASDTVWRAVHVAREAGKPVVASLGPKAASGGYFVAMAADKIVAESGTVTGSIGVLTLKFTTKELWRKLGVDWDRIASNSRATLPSQVEDYPPGGAGRMSAILDAIYADFAGKAAKARDLTAQQMDAVARGRIWSGKDALAVGLIDAVGGMNAALDELRTLLKLPPAASFRLVDLPAPSKIEQFLMALQEQGIDIRGAVNWLTAAPTPLENAFAVLREKADVLIPPDGVLQMPAWRIAD
ncbi:MAG: signal peptide peptidase SppA [Alphaproteobacteria bacterium]|nr:signal peptide peptidase SppA [Alphaproteobacteria bacterium]